MHPLQHTDNHEFSSLWRWTVSVVVAVVCLLLTDVAPAACFGKELGRSNFDVEWGSDRAKELQSAINAAYPPSESQKENLTDGKIGPKTIDQFELFCTDINLAEASSLSKDALAARLVDALIAFKDIDDTPKWEETVRSEEFSAWRSRQCDGTFGRFFGYRKGAKAFPGGAFMLDAFDKRQAAERSEIPLSGRFVLKEEDIKALGTVAGLDKPPPEQPSIEDLGTQLAEELELDDAQLKALIGPLLNNRECITKYKVVDPVKLAGLPQELLDALSEQDVFDSKPDVQAYIAPVIDALETRYNVVAGALPTPQSADEETDEQADGEGGEENTEAPAQPDASSRITLLNADLPATLVAKLHAEDSTSVVKEELKGYRDRIDSAIEPVYFYTITDPTSITSGLSDVLPDLAGLQDIRFPNRDLFRKAVRVTTGLGENEAALLDIIVRVALKVPPYEDEPVLPAIQWRGGDCGCGVFEGLDSEYPSHLYGMYPFWEALQKKKTENEAERTIDFSMLDRIGYYAVSLRANGTIRQKWLFQQNPEAEGSWIRKRLNYAKFVKRAHQYKTKVDLVVYNSVWDEWLKQDTSKEDTPANQLVGDLVTVITERIEGPVNAIKPLISLRFSPARTMADGVTFDFDFGALNVKEQQQLFSTLR